MKRTATLLAILLCGTASLHAAILISYPDIEARSPNGRYLAEAKSPDNKNNNFGSFQSNFTVTLTDTETNKPVWSWKQGKDDGISPMELIPGDNGQLAMVFAWSGYVFFDSSGVEQGAFDVGKLIPDDELKKFTAYKFKETEWKQYSQQRFFTRDGAMYFYLRLYWGRTIIIDVAKEKLETDGKIAEEVEKHVVEQTRRFITEFNGEYYEKCGSHCVNNHPRKDLAAAVFIVKKHNLKEYQEFMDEVVRRHEDAKYHELKRCLDLLE